LADKLKNRYPAVINFITMLIGNDKIALKNKKRLAGRVSIVGKIYPIQSGGEIRLDFVSKHYWCQTGCDRVSGFFNACLLLEMS